jgi:hypothetical protein
MLNTLSAEQCTELEHLKSAFFDRQVVQVYLQAQDELLALCQVLGDQVSESIGLNYVDLQCGEI